MGEHPPPPDGYVRLDEHEALMKGWTYLIEITREHRKNMVVRWTILGFVFGVLAGEALHRWFP